MVESVICCPNFYCRDHHGVSSTPSQPLSTASVSKRARSPTDRHHSRHREDRSRSRSPHRRLSAASRSSDMHNAAKEAEIRLAHQRFSTGAGELSSANMLSEHALRNGFPTSVAPTGHAFSSVPPLVKQPASATSHFPSSHMSALDFERDARQHALRQQQERDRLQYSASAAAAAAASNYAASLMPTQMLGSNCNTAAALMFRDRMMTDQRDRMLLAAAAAEYESRSSLGPTSMASLSRLYQPPLPAHRGPDGLLGSAEGMMLAAQSSLRRPSANQPPMTGPSGLKLPSTFGSVIDSSAIGGFTNAAAHLNLPFR